MEKKQILTLMMVIILSSLVLSGCSENSRGTFGPAWDVAYEVPITNNEGKTAKELVEDNEDIVNNNGLIQYSKTEEMDIIDVGGKLTEIALPSVNKTVALPKIKLGDTNDPNNNVFSDKISSLNMPNTVIPSGGTINESDLNSISIDLSNEFNSITFSDINNGGSIDNKMNISVTNNTPLTITNLQLGFTDTNGKNVSTTVTNNVGIWDLNGVEFSNFIGVNLSLTLTNESGNNVTLTDNDKISFTFSLPEAEITKVVGYDLPATNVIESTNVASVEVGLEAVAFNSGNLDLTILPPETETSGLNFAIEQLSIGTVSDGSADNEISLDLTGQSIDLINGMDIDFNLIVSGTNVTYDTTQSILVTGGFSSDTEIASVTVNNPFSFSDANQVLDEELLTEVPEDIDSISLNGAIARFIIEGYDIENLLINLDNVEFKAIYEDGSEATITLSSISEGSAVINSTNNELSLLNDSETDFLDWLQGLDYKEDITSVRLIGDAIVAATGSVTIDSADQLTPKVEIEVPFDITLNKDIEDRAIPETVDDSLSDDDVEQIDNYFKEGQLIIEDFKNDLPVDVEVIVYLGKVDEWEGKDLDDYLDSLSEEEKESQLDKLYKSANKFKIFTLTKQDSGEKKVVDLTASDADWLTDDNLYVGVKYKVTGDNIVLKSTDEVTINNLYAKLVVKVNQNKE